MKLNVRTKQRTIKSITFITIFVLAALYLVIFNYDLDKSLFRKIFCGESSPMIMNCPVALNYDRKDWHDWDFIEYEKTREGPGEQGQAFYLTGPGEIEANKKLFQVEGLFVVVSDKISVNRSVPDTRLQVCQKIKYLKILPSVSVIVIFHNEWLSVLLRTLHSIYNRTPKELLHEILLVNDASTKKELHEPLTEYLRRHFDHRIKVVNLKERKGLIVARMEGARRATGEVLVFFDAHIEVNVNWLPPLLEPIAIDPKTATVPIVDNFNNDDFQFTSNGNGTRGVFDWNLIFRWMPRRPEDLVHPEQPATLPVMLGCAFAIRKDYFFDLGGYDEQLKIWNGENYELSFKLWLCGGKLLEVPCSRVAHTFRHHNAYRMMDDNYDFVAYNLKRIAEVWLDDYKQYLYRNEPERYANVDPGDLTRQKQLRKDLNCKPFQFFLEQVMPDQVERYPFIDRGVFASGTIRSESNPKLCIDNLGGATDKPLSIFRCHKNLTSPGKRQSFVLTWHRQIRTSSKVYENCLDTFQTSLWPCHFEFGHQLWFYNLTSHQLINPPDNCLSAKISTHSLEMRTCSDEDAGQKWLWGFTNTSALEHWENFGVKLPDLTFS